MPNPQSAPLSDARIGDICCTSRGIAHFVLNFVAMATGFGRGKMPSAAFDGPFLKTLYRRKNIAKISYTSQVIANFVPNFVAMATKVGRGKMRLAAFDGPFPKTPYRRKNIAKISYTSRVIACLLYTSPSPRDRQKSRMPSSA